MRALEVLLPAKLVCVLAFSVTIMMMPTPSVAFTLQHQSISPIVGSTPINNARRHSTNKALQKNSPSSRLLLLSSPPSSNLSSSISMSSSNNDNNNDNFDGEGFANYLAPYALALFASIAVTAGFVKFVLMDY